MAAGADDAGGAILFLCLCFCFCIFAPCFIIAGIILFAFAGSCQGCWIAGIPVTAIGVMCMPYFLILAAPFFAMCLFTLVVLFVGPHFLYFTSGAIVCSYMCVNCCVVAGVADVELSGKIDEWEDGAEERKELKKQKLEAKKKKLEEKKKKLEEEAKKKLEEKKKKLEEEKVHPPNPPQSSSGSESDSDEETDESNEPEDYNHEESIDFQYLNEEENVNQNPNEPPTSVVSVDGYNLPNEQIQPSAPAMNIPVSGEFNNEISVQEVYNDMKKNESDESDSDNKNNDINNEEGAYMKPVVNVPYYEDINNNNNNASDDEDLCVICNSRKKIMQVIPCGHLCMCKECVLGGGHRGKCPVCEESIESCIKIVL